MHKPIRISNRSKHSGLLYLYHIDGHGLPLGHAHPAIVADRGMREFHTQH